MGEKVKEYLFDLEKYQVFRDAIHRWFENKNYAGKDVARDISEFSAALGCPIIASYAFYMEVFGSTPELEEKLKFFLEFYQFSGIKKQGSSDEVPSEGSAS